MKACQLCGTEFEPKSAKAEFCSRKCQTSRARYKVLEPVAGRPGELPLDRVHPDPDNVRDDLGDLDELAQSIGEIGVLQALLVRDHPEQPGHAIVIAGHRRLAAAALANLTCVPVSWARAELDVTAAMVVENTHRDGLSPLEEARALARMRSDGLSQREIGRRIGRTQAHVSRRLGLLELPEVFQRMADTGSITMEQAQQIGQLGKVELERLTTSAVKAGRVEAWEIQSAKVRDERAKTVAEVMAELWPKVEAAGIPVLDPKPLWNDPAWPFNQCWFLGDRTRLGDFDDWLAKAQGVARDDERIWLYATGPVIDVEVEVEPQDAGKTGSKGDTSSTVTDLRPAVPLAPMDPRRRFVIDHLEDRADHELFQADIDLVLEVAGACAGQGAEFYAWNLVVNVEEEDRRWAGLVMALSSALESASDLDRVRGRDVPPPTLDVLLVAALTEWLNECGYEHPVLGETNDFDDAASSSTEPSGDE